MKIKQRKNYIHLAVTIVPVLSTPETFQGQFCLRQPFLSSTASAGGFLADPPYSFSAASLVTLPPSAALRSIPSSPPSLVICSIFAKMELIEVVFAAARYYDIAFDVTGNVQRCLYKRRAA